MPPEILIDSIRIRRLCEYWATRWYHRCISLKWISVSFTKLKFSLDAHVAYWSVYERHWEAIICSAETLSIGLYLKPEWAVSNSLTFSCSHPVVIKTSCKSVKHVLNRQGNVLMCFRSYLVGKKEAKVLLTSWVYCCFLSNVTFLCSLKVVQFMGSKLSSSCHLLFLRKIWSIFTCIVFEWIQWLLMLSVSFQFETIFGSCNNGLQFVFTLK